jgi:hypothetical protein
MNQIRKRLLRPPVVIPDAIDVTECAVVEYSSEHPAHPVEHLFDASTGPGGTRWIGAQAEAAERIQIAFDQPQSIRRLIFEAEERDRARTQEVRVEASTDGGSTYRQVLVQEYSFSPQGATFQREDLRFELDGVTHLRLTVVPNKNGFGAASLTSLRIFRSRA